MAALDVSQDAEVTLRERVVRCCRCQRLPLNLMWFMFPVICLIPYYVTIFATSYVAVGNVIAAQNFWAMASSRAGLAREIPATILQALAGTGFASFAQFFVATTWQELVDLQAVNSYLVFNDISTGRPIGTGLDANPSPTPFVALLSAPELKGVPGVSSSDLAQISAAFQHDACPLVLAVLSGMTPEQCYAFAGGKNNGGLLSVVGKFIAAAEKLASPKSMQVAEARNLDTVVPLDGLGWSFQDVMDSGALQTIRDTSNRILWPAFSHVADLYGTAAQQIAMNQGSFVVEFSASFTTIFTVVVLLVLLPVVGALARQLRRKRTLLLLMPVPLVIGFKPLRALVKQAVSEVEAEEGIVANKGNKGAGLRRASI